MKALDCLTKDCIDLLLKNKLLVTLIKSELINNVLSKVKIKDELKEEIISQSIKKIGISSDSEFEKWLIDNNITKDDFESVALREIRSKLFCKDNFENKLETRFLERKSQLDIVVYSLIRITDYFKAQEIYLRISEEKASFGELATKYSEGRESKSNGIVGPVPLEQAHPRLVKLLQSIKPGVTQAPVKVSNFNLIIRLESYEPAELNDSMREKMGEELFNIMIDEQTVELRNKLLSSKSYSL